MKKPSSPDQNELNLFREEFADLVPLRQDKITPKRPSSKQKSDPQENFRRQNAERRQAAASFHFSDGFEAHFDHSGPLKYIKPGSDSFEVKRLRRGEYPPELILDLHGLKQDEAKLEVAALIQAAQKQHVHCVCIVHGIGGQILKRRVPNWLVQHPAVLGFHQAPLEWGGQGALLVLIDIPRDQNKF